MNDEATPNPTPPPAAPPVAHLELKAALLLALLAVLLASSVLYVMYARGVFESTQRLVLIAEDSEGVQVGMDMTFSGFPIGRVRRIELGEDGNARILVDVPKKDAHWLRESSVFTLVRGLVGNVNIRAYSGILADPPLADGAERKALEGDATAEIPQLLSAVRDLVQNLTAMSRNDSPLAATLGNLQSVTERLKGRHGALGVLLGNDEDASKLVKALDRTNALLARADGLATNARLATNDLGLLRADVDASLRKVEHLIDEINRKWPFARDTELKLR